MTEDLLCKETGFRQLNKELEQKAHDLMKKIDYVINTYNNESASGMKRNNVDIVKGRKEYLKNVGVQDEDASRVSIKRNSSLPHIFDQPTILKSKAQPQRDGENEVSKKMNLTNKIVVDTFKSKINLLQCELQTLRMEYKKKCDVCKNVEAESKKAEIKLKNEIELLKETVAKLENTNKELRCEAQMLNTENLTLKKDMEKLEKRVKVASQQSNICITRLNRSLENNDKLKCSLKCFEVEEKELKTQIRKIEEDRRLTVGSLGKQLSELIQVLKKQMLIVDNLKKQNACLVAIGQLKFTEEDFARLLTRKHEAT